MTRRDPASPTLTRKRRCAVYTRKSTDEGLEKEFNSLDAQRESCEAYIASQRSEGWVLVHDRYDDGRVSGGTLERPALKRLLARNRSPALLRGLIFGADGRALSPTHTRKQGRLYRYYVSQSALKGGMDDAPYRRLPAGEIEALVLDQLRALLRQPEVVVGTWRAARAEAPDLGEDTVRDALARFEPVWSELFTAEQERLIRLLLRAWRMSVRPWRRPPAARW